MPIVNVREQNALALYCLKWSALGAWVGVLSGAASAAFLAALDWATNTRVANPSLLLLLPVGGLVTGIIYSTIGKSVEGGNNLLLEKIHNPDSVIPTRMAPLILVSTVMTHLFGGSAGREGTAVQMGGSLAQMGIGRLKLSKADHRILIMAGIAAGFGSVFGTPIAGMIFGMEVFALGRMQYDGLLPCLVASLVGDWVCRGLGIHHHEYFVGAIPSVTPILVLWIAVSGVLFSLASMLFTELTIWMHTMAKQIRWHWMRPAVGGGAVIILALIFGRDYLGLGIPLIDRSFTGNVFPWTFALKVLFTAVTLGFGFKGGEVTPLFCVGSTLGAAFAALTHQPPGLFAALGFVAVFAGAANTPIACIAMGIELFGSQLAVPLAISCVVSYILSGHRGIYLSQRVAMPKASSVVVSESSTLRDMKTGGLEVTPSKSSWFWSLSPKNFEAPSDDPG